METFEVDKSVFIPAIGFGTWQITGQECTDAVLKALEVGYRHIDTAEKYGNHQDIAKALKESSIERNDLFLTSKVWFEELSYENVLKACSTALEELQTPYLDLYLVHWPNRAISPSDTFRAMQELKDKKLIRAYGVSNYTKHHLQDCIDAGYKPAVNQIELHPTLAQLDLAKYCQDANIILTAYSPLGHGTELNLPEITKIASKYGKTNAQVIINWIISRGIVAIPKSVNPARITENFGSVGWKLAVEDVEKINKLDRNNRQLITDWADFDY